MLPAEAAPSLGNLKLYESRPRRLRGGAWTLPGQRLAELELLINARFGPRGVDTDDWRVIAAVGLNHLVAHVRLLPVREDRPSEAELCRSWLARFCPCVDQAAADELIAKVVARPRKFRASKLGTLLALTADERKALGIRTIRDCDRTPAERRAAKLETDRRRKERERRERGCLTREEYIARSDAELARQLGCRRETIYRHRKAGTLDAFLARRRTSQVVPGHDESRNSEGVPPMRDAPVTFADQARSRHPNPPAIPSEVAIAARQCAGRVAAISRPVRSLAAALRALGRAAAAIQEERNAA